MTLAYSGVPGLAVPGAFDPGLALSSSAPPAPPPVAPGGYVTISPAGPGVAAARISAAGPAAASVTITVP